MTYQSVYTGGMQSPMKFMEAFFLKIKEKFSDQPFDLSRNDIHRLFYNEISAMPHLVKHFAFNGNKKYPFSQKIEDVLYEMTVCGMVSRPNPTMVKYHFVSLDEKSYENLETPLQEAIDRLVSNLSDGS